MNNKITEERYTRETGKRFTGNHFHIESWEEFVDTAKEFGGEVDENGFVKVRLAFDGYIEEYMLFMKEGKIAAKVSFGSGVIATDRTYDQMFEVLRALK